jgi:hypothetical protein
VSQTQALRPPLSPLLKPRESPLAGDVLIVAAEQVALFVDDHGAAIARTRRRASNVIVGDLTAKARANGMRLGIARLISLHRVSHSLGSMATCSAMPKKKVSPEEESQERRERPLNDRSDNSAPAWQQEGCRCPIS